MATTKTSDSVRYGPVIIWLYICCFAVLAMAVIGAITRLTESGLSLVEWKPITGALPPLTEEAWLHQYELYKQSPEFIHKHSWMALGDFKQIFFWEWFHRLWGRLIGLIYAGPLLYFWIKKQLPSGYGAWFLGLFLLGGLQGVIGWWMVTSGLVDSPTVSPYRLAIHLSLALVIFSLMWRLALDLKEKQQITNRQDTAKASNATLLPHVLAGVILLSLTIVWGAFVAGFDAGLIYNSFPLMSGQFTPPEPYSLAAVINNHGWIQFSHRWLAMLTGLVLLSLSWRLRDWLLGGMVLLQITLGISTLLTQVSIPLAAAHQAGAIILLALSLRALHQIKVNYCPAGPVGEAV